MLLHETPKAGEVCCHAGDAHHSAFGCQRNGQKTRLQTSLYIFTCRGEQSPVCPKYISCDPGPVMVLSPSNICNLLIPSLRGGQHYPLGQMKKLKHSETTGLVLFTKSGDQVELGSEARLPVTQLCSDLLLGPGARLPKSTGYFVVFCSTVKPGLCMASLWDKIHGFEHRHFPSVNLLGTHLCYSLRCSGNSWCFSLFLYFLIKISFPQNI